MKAKLYSPNCYLVKLAKYKRKYTTIKEKICQKAPAPHPNIHKQGDSRNETNTIFIHDLNVTFDDSASYCLR